MNVLIILHRFTKNLNFSYNPFRFWNFSVHISLTSVKENDLFKKKCYSCCKIWKYQFFKRCKQKFKKHTFPTYRNTFFLINMILWRWDVLSMKKSAWFTKKLNIFFYILKHYFCIISNKYGFMKENDLIHLLF